MRGFSVISTFFVGCVATATILPLLVAKTAAAAYFYVQESQDKCFLESVPTGVALTASYKNHENPGETACRPIFSSSASLLSLVADCAFYSLSFV